MTNASPTLKIAWSSRAGSRSSHSSVIGSPVISTMPTSTMTDMIRVWNWVSMTAMRQAARGKCSARIRPRLPVIDSVPCCTTAVVKLEDEQAGNRGRR